MNCTAILTKDEIDEVFDKLNLDLNENDNNHDTGYYNLWDFGKEPDETHGVVTINANLSLLI